MSTQEASLTASVLSTLAYAEVFKTPLNRWQLRSFLHGTQLFSDSTVNLFLATHGQLWDKKVFKNQHWEAVCQPSDFQLPKLAGRRVKQVVDFARFCPSIDSLWLTGSLAVGSQQENQDIDFLVICKPGTLWTTRALISIWGILQGKLRRRSGEHTSNKWCFNYWLENDDLAINEDQHNLYQAREVIQARPVYQDKPGAALMFLKANTWAAGYSFTGWIHSFGQSRKLMANKRVIRYIPGIDVLLLAIFKLLNPVLYQLQYRYMSVLPADVQVNQKKALFHSRWRQKRVLAKYETILQLLD